MKARVFDLMSRRNLTTVGDFEGEFNMIAPEAQIVKALTYEERFDLDPQGTGGVFIVAGDGNGGPISEASKKLVIDSLKNRVVMGTTVSVIPPEIVPLDVVLEVYYNPDNLTSSIEIEAQTIYETLINTLNPLYLGLGADLNHQDLVKLIYANSPVVDKINVLNVNVMIPDSTSLDGLCAGFSGEDSADDTECLYNYAYVVDSSTPTYKSPSKITSFKMWRCNISLTSSISYNSHTFTYNNIYTPVF
jgi:hypothetical protein